MKERQKETAFLRRIIGFQNTNESHKLEQRIKKLHLDARCVRRTMAVVVLLGALAAAFLAYGKILAYDIHWLLVEVLCVVGLAAVISLAVLVGHLIAYRYLLNRMREESRQLIVSLLESLPGKADTAHLRDTLKQASEPDRAQDPAENRPVPESIARPEQTSPDITQSSRQEIPASQ